jgi:hypothetical protein
VRQRLRQQAEQALAVDGFAGGAHNALLRHPNEKTPVNEGHASATAVFAKTAVGTGTLRKVITRHE